MATPTAAGGYTTADGRQRPDCRAMRGFAIVIATALLPTTTSAQALGAGDFATLSDYVLTRCLDHMEAGNLSDLSGLREVTDASDTIFTDIARTADDRVAVDAHVFNGLRSCDAATNSVVAFLDSGAVFNAMAASFDTVMESVIARGYREVERCAADGYALSGARLLEEGDYLRSVIGEDETRPGLVLLVEASITRFSGDGGILVEEHYGAPDIEC